MACHTEGWAERRQPPSADRNWLRHLAAPAGCRQEGKIFLARTVYHMLSRIGRMCVAKRLLTEKSFDILYTLYMSRSNITRYWTQYDKWKTKTLFKLWTHKRHPMFHPYGQVMASEIAKTLGSTLIRHRSDASASDWCLNDVAPRFFAIWDTFSEFFGDKISKVHCMEIIFLESTETIYHHKVKPWRQGTGCAFRVQSLT